MDKDAYKNPPPSASLVRMFANIGLQNFAFDLFSLDDMITLQVQVQIRIKKHFGVGTPTILWRFLHKGFW